MMAAAPRSTRTPAALIVVSVLVLFLSSCSGWVGPYRNDVAILVSDDTPAYQQVADALGKRLGSATRVIRLDNDNRKADAARRTLAQSDETIVAVGAFAASSTHGLSDRPIIVCQVFNYEEPGLVTPAVRVVKATPPVLKQFQTWAQLDPRLRHVAMITGAGLTELPAEARRAAAELGIRLMHIEARSDKEALYAVRSMDPPAQGIWIAPDHRIFSNAALRELVTYAVRQGMQVMVFNHRLLSLGALVSAENDPDDVAERVYDLLARDYKRTAVARVVPLQRARIQVNAIVAKQFGLPVPPALAKGSYGS